MRDPVSDSSDRGCIALCFKTHCGEIVGVEMSLDIEKRMLKAIRTKLIILNVSNKIKALVILNLILSMEDGLEYPEGKLD